MRTLKALVAAAVLAVSTGAGWGQQAPQQEVLRPWRGVEYRFVRVTEPAPEEVHLAVIDLTAPGVKVRVARGGPDPDGAGEATTTLMGTTKIAEREGFDLAVNGDYFSMVKAKVKDAEGVKAQEVFKGGAEATVIGPAMTDGELWVKAKEPRPALVVKKDGTVAIEKTRGDVKGAVQAIAGNVMLVEDGKALYQDEPDEAFVKQKNTNRQRHPRTVAGVSKDGKTLYLMVVDGRSEISRGMNWKELAKTAADAGCWEAVNLDGGGSSTFVMRDPKSGELKVWNKPSDKKERSVANVVGVKIGKKK